MRIISRYASGRVESVQIGAIEVTGRQLRGALDLPSANFTIEFVDGDVRVATLGYGHGVGMSQYGANAMAKEGATIAPSCNIIIPASKLKTGMTG